MFVEADLWNSYSNAGLGENCCFLFSGLCWRLYIPLLPVGDTTLRGLALMS